MLQIGTMGLYLCLRKLKNGGIFMWIGVLIFVFLSVEVLSYLSGGKARKEKRAE